MTHNDILWFRKGEYKVLPDRPIGLFAWRRLGSLGKLAVDHRKLGKRVLNSLPGLPDEIRDAILRIAGEQEAWITRQQEARLKSEGEDEQWEGVGKY